MPETKTCKECGGRGHTTVDGGTHVDIIPCRACTPPVNNCRNGHSDITFYGFICPLCAAHEKLEALRAELNIAADAEQIAKRIQVALEGKL